MASPSWTLSDLQVLESALKQGTLKVEYSDKKITYRSLDEMIRLRNLMRRDLGLTDKQFTRIKSEFDKETC